MSSAKGQWGFRALVFLALFSAGLAAGTLGLGWLTLWPLHLFIVWFPSPCFPTPDGELCEGTPVQIAAFGTGATLTVVFYLLMAFLSSHWLIRRGDPRTQ